LGIQNRKKAYELNGVPLGIIKEKKDLGVFVSQDLKVGNGASKPHLRETRCWG